MSEAEAHQASTATGKESRRRRPFLAALLSFFGVGIGQLYNGQPRKAGLFWVLQAFVVLLLDTLRLTGLNVTSAGFGLAVTLVLAMLAICLVSIVDAVRGARRVREIALARYQRWYVYVAIWILFVAVNGTLAALKPVAAYDIPSRSMLPTLHVGDHIWAATGAYRSRLPKRAEIVVFKSPADQTTDFLKRVVGLPGDRVQLRQGRLYINDRLVDRAPLARETVEFDDETLNGLQLYRETLPSGLSYLIVEQSDEDTLDNTEAFVVPPDHVFVLGDNRDHSLDSRSSGGFVPASLLRDKPLYIYWSADLSRIGTKINAESEPEAAGSK